jgi:hypothetical protein
MLGKSGEVYAVTQALLVLSNEASTTVHPSGCDQPNELVNSHPPGDGETASPYCGRLDIKRGGAKVKRG